MQCGGKLQRTLEGPAYDCFAKALRGLAAAKLTKPGSFRTADQSGYAVRCSYKVPRPLCVVTPFRILGFVACCLACAL